MNLDVLLKEYANDPRCFKIVDRITASQPQRIQLSGLQGSATPFVVSSVFSNPAASQLNHLIILRDAEEAAYFHNTLENISKALNLFYFPSSFKNKKNYRLLNPSHVMLRTECLTRFSTPTRGDRVGIIITYAEAMFEKVVLPKTLSANIISIKQGDELEVNTILGKLVDMVFHFQKNRCRVYPRVQRTARAGTQSPCARNHDRLVCRVVYSLQAHLLV